MTREEAIECYKEMLGMSTIWYDEYYEALRMAIKALEEPERKKGKWRRRLVDNGFNADWHCSECGWITSLEEHGYNFCPNCGADMRGEQDG